MIYLILGVVYMGSIKQEKILLLDSDKLLTNELAGRLVNVGFDVLAANDAQTALKLLEVATPSVILLDLSMKTPDGKEFLMLLKEKDTFSDVPTIILSQDTDASTKVYGFLHGANDYVCKPFDFQEILARINNQLRLYNKLKELVKKNRELTNRNILLEQMAITDSLTQVYNKGYILKRLDTELTRTIRYKEKISVIMLDIDYFKKINDVYGHIAGDAILKKLSDKLTESVRDVDIVGRYGGEEFVIVCPNTSMSGATILAERIRENVQNTLFQAGGTDIRITVSLGLSSLSSQTDASDDFSSVKLLEEADLALYKAKSAGRNRVALFSKELGAICTEGNIKAKPAFDESEKAKDKFAH